jgi:hypothetical protein
MRAALALFLSAVLVALSWAPHVHGGVQGDHECPACLARTVDAAHSETPDLAPQPVRFMGVVFAPVEIEPAGAPLGAIPGQSPPAIA